MFDDYFDAVQLLIVCISIEFGTLYLKLYIFVICVSLVTKTYFFKHVICWRFGSIVWLVNELWIKNSTLCRRLVLNFDFNTANALIFHFYTLSVQCFDLSQDFKWTLCFLPPKIGFNCCIFIDSCSMFI